MYCIINERDQPAAKECNRKLYYCILQQEVVLLQQDYVCLVVSVCVHVC